MELIDDPGDRRLHDYRLLRSATARRRIEGQLADLVERGVRVLLDDRTNVSPGVKFKDAELLGMPTIVVVGKRLADGVVEVRDRASGDRTEVDVHEVATAVAELCGR